MQLVRDGRWFWWVAGACGLALLGDVTAVGPWGQPGPAPVRVLGEQIERPAGSTTSTSDGEPPVPVTSEATSTTFEAPSTGTSAVTATTRPVTTTTQRPSSIAPTTSAPTTTVSVTTTTTEETTTTTEPTTTTTDTIPI